MSERAQAVSVQEPSTAMPSWRQLAGWRTTVLLVLVGWLYAPILGRLVQQWWTDPNFSHGFFVPAFVGFVVWFFYAGDR